MLEARMERCKDLQKIVLVQTNNTFLFLFSPTRILSLIVCLNLAECCLHLYKFCSQAPSRTDWAGGSSTICWPLILPLTRSFSHQRKHVLLNPATGCCKELLLIVSWSEKMQAQEPSCSALFPSQSWLCKKCQRCLLNGAFHFCL